MTAAVVIGDNGEMSGSSVTPPKGRATRARNADPQNRGVLSSKMQWAVAIIIGCAVLALVLYLGRDVRSDLNGAGLSDVTAVVVDPSSA